jgi:hypothetical protein
MAAFGFIIGYGALWLAWTALAAVVLTPRPHRRAPAPTPLGFRLCAQIFGSALAPVFVLSSLAYCTRWIAQPINETLSLMTPVMLAFFVTEQLGRHLRLEAEGQQAP